MDVVAGAQEAKISEVSKTVTMLLIFIDYLIVQGTAQREALAAMGGRGDSPSKRDKLKAKKMLKKTRRIPTVSCTLCWAVLVIRLLHHT